MGYYVITESRRNDMTLFLVDRTLTKRQWWTTEEHLAMRFNKKSAAEYSAKNLTFNTPEVITAAEAQEIFNRQEARNIEDEEHPFSSEALGQS